MFYLTKKRKIYLGIAVLILIIAVVQIFFLKKSEPPVFVEVRQTDNSMVIESGIREKTEPVEVKITVDIKGAVMNPGVYEMNEGDRVEDAIEIAGGALEEADLNKINRAEKVFDEMVICIPKKGEDTECQSIISSAGVNTSGKININTAGEEQLMQLSGIGPSKAKAIIDYRNKNGKFTKLEEIMNVTGIGPNLYKQFEDKISLH